MKQKGLSRILACLLGLCLLAGCGTKPAAPNTAAPDPSKQGTSAAQSDDAPPAAPSTEAAESADMTMEPPTEEPTTEAPTEEPATEAPTEEPSAEAPTKEPAMEAPTEEPSTEVPTEEPTTEVPTEEPTTEAPTEEPATEPSADPEPSSDETAEQLAALRDWMTQPMSVDMEMYYSYYPLYGFSYTIRQLTGEDESFRFSQIYSTFPSQAYTDGEEDAPWQDTEVVDWYYCWENGVFVCYHPDGSRAELSHAARREVLAEASLVFGQEAILPEELAGFTDCGTDEASGNRVFEYWLPVSALLESGTMPAWLMNAAISWSDGMTTLLPAAELEQADPAVRIRLEAEPDTLRPIRAAFDFAEVKPYLFGNGPLSAEYALILDVMYLTVAYSFALPPTVERDQLLDDGFLETP